MNKNYWMTLIAKERSEQILVHGHTIESDIEKNSEEQLVKGAIALILKPPKAEGFDSDEIRSLKPKGWNNEVWEKMMKKSYKEKLVTAAALLAAQIDVVIALEEAQEK